jgi:hypothetical protein
LNKKSSKVIVQSAILILIFAVLIISLSTKPGIRGAIANNLWSSTVIKGYPNGTLSTKLLLAAPTGHPHASLLQASERLNHTPWLPESN